MVALPQAAVIIACVAHEQMPSYVKIVDSAAMGGTPKYAYAPSIVVENGVYHVFYCSQGDGTGWDFIRYTVSADNGKRWSAPVVKLRSTANVGPNGLHRDLAACDPSVVYFNGFWYLFYSSAVEAAAGVYRTVVQVARAAAIDGPYLTYTERGTWEDTPADPKMIIKPFAIPAANAARERGYGAGQQTVVVRGGTLYMWYMDDSIAPVGVPKTYRLQSNDPTVWKPHQNRELNIRKTPSSDFKFDPVRSGFVMMTITGEHTARSYLQAAFSADGLTWGPLQTVIGPAVFPEYAHNVGVSGDDTGALLPGPAFVGFGAPWGLASSLSWGEWDLYGAFVTMPWQLQASKR